MSRVLCINPGSTSTKIAVFDDASEVCVVTLRHGAGELAPRVADQAEARLAVVLDALHAAGVDVESLDAVVGRGGLVRPLAGGTYLVDEALLADLGSGRFGEHASNLGGVLAQAIASSVQNAELEGDFGPTTGENGVLALRFARTSSGTGSVRASSGTGSVRASSGTGSVRASSGTGSVRASSGTGPEGSTASAGSARAAAGAVIPAFIVDPVVVDELADEARFSGHPAIERRSIFHALNQKAVARRWAAEHGRDYADCNLIVAHLGGGISVGAHQGGRVVDVNNALDGDGPFAPERAGVLPTASWAKLILSKGLTAEQTARLLVGGGGLASLVGTSDVREIVKRGHSTSMEAPATRQADVECAPVTKLDPDRASGQGDFANRAHSLTADSGVTPPATVECAPATKLDPTLALDALTYQVSKEIGACAAVLRGQVDAIVLTGGLTFESATTDAITARVAFIAPVTVYPGEDEMPALRDGALRVLNGHEEAKTYA